MGYLRVDGVGGGGGVRVHDEGRMELLLVFGFWFRDLSGFDFRR